jgi:RNA polymerase sigma-70 factor (ECF subfamily)
MAPIDDDTTRTVSPADGTDPDGGDPDAARRTRGEGRWSALMVNAQAGDAESYRQLLGELRDVIESYLTRRFGNREWVDDCVQESLLALHRARRTYDPRRRFWPWMVTIVKHKAVDLLRRGAVRARNEIVSDDALGRAATSPGSRNDSALDTERILGWLNAEYRQALVLTKLEGHSIEEAATMAGVSPSAMKTRVHRAIRLVQRRLEKEPT